MMMMMFSVLFFSKWNRSNKNKNINKQWKTGIGEHKSAELYYV